MDNTYFERERPRMKTSPFQIFVNQTGYYNKSEKIGVIPHAADRFEIINERNEVVYSKEVKHFGIDEFSKDDAYIAEFTDFASSGVYKLVANGCESAPFTIGTDVYDKVFRDVMKAFYYLRCGIDLKSQYAGKYIHKACHTDKAFLWEDRSVSLDVTGGWHDAGDYGRYVTAGCVAVAHILYGYEMYPDAFKNVKLNIPDSEGILPDILAECKVEIDWILKMQRKDGGAYHKATTKQHAAFVMPEEDCDDMFVFPISSFATADMCALFALASRIYKAFDAEYAQKLKERALRSADFLAQHPEYIGFRNPEGVNTGWYLEREDIDNRYWAYAELFRLTSDEKYNEAFLKLYPEQFHKTALGYGWVGGLGSLAYILNEKADKAVSKALKEEFCRNAEVLADISQRCAYGAAMSEYDYCWGSNMNLLKNAMVFCIAHRFFPHKCFDKYAARQINVLLGCNALGISYVTGNGAYRCNNPHLRPAYADGIEECMPGMVCGGPNRTPQDPDARILIPEGTPPMKCFADDYGCYSLNEITIYWNSPAVFVLAFLISVR